MGDLEDLKKVLESASQIRLGENVEIKLRAHRLTKETVFDFTKNKLDRLVKAELQEKTSNKRKYKAYFDSSKRHDLIVVYKVFKSEVLIITAYETTRKWQKRIQKISRRV